MSEKSLLGRIAAWLVLAVLVIGGGAGAWQITSRLLDRTDGLLRYVRVDSWTVNAAQQELQWFLNLIARHAAGDPAADPAALRSRAARLKSTLRLLTSAAPQSDLFTYADVAETAESVLVDLEKVDRALAGLPREAGSPSLLATVDRLLSPHAEELTALAGSIAHTRLQLQDRDIGTMIGLVGLNRIMLLVFFGVAGCFTLLLSVEAVAARRAESEARAGERRMRHMAEHDSLTDLANRDQFHAVMADRLADPGRSTALLLVDIDGFNEINDVFGHEEGDAALVEVGKSLRALARGSELVARLGGDEFALLLNGDAGTALTRAKAVTELFAAPIETASRSHRLAASIGVAMAPIDGQTLDALLKAADLALYAAKARGHGQIARFEAAIGDAFIRRKTIEAALETGAFVAGLTLVFQPQVELATGRLVGAEALMRYVDPALGAIRPDKFVAIAEQTGHITALDQHILEAACREALTWRGALAEGVIAVNLSPIEFLRGDVVASVQDVLARTGLPPHRLELEITEGVLVEDAQAVRSVLERFRALGIEIAIDDFGTGYSSLAYLSDLPVDKLKLDRAFLSDIETDHGRRVIVRGAMTMAHEMGLRTIAEGIETESHRRLLEAFGCHQGQGYLFSPGLPSADFQHFAERHRSTALEPCA